MNAELTPCHYQVFNDLRYTDCLGGNQMVDVLESGSSNVSPYYIADD